MDATPPMDATIAERPTSRYPAPMPELPEVETVRRGLAAAMVGRRITGVTVHRGDLRRPLPDDFVARLTGRRIVALRRRAKYLLVDLDDETVLLAHLGMSGRMLVAQDGAGAAPGHNTAGGRHEHVIFALGNGTTIRFADPRRFGLMVLTTRAALDTHPLIAGLGPEPTGEDFTGPVLAARLAGRRTPIKAALLDQRVVAGIGNIYACEALFAARLSPRRMAASVQGRRAARLADAIRSVLAAAIDAGGSSLRDHVAPSGTLGYFQHAFAVYGREGAPCPDCRCAGGVRRMRQAGRSTFYCAMHQR
jgi:formamidopyrimidine-DNA glycosylase